MDDAIVPPWDPSHKKFRYGDEEPFTVPGHAHPKYEWPQGDSESELAEFKIVRVAFALSALENKYRTFRPRWEFHRNVLTFDTLLREATINCRLLPKNANMKYVERDRIYELPLKLVDNRHVERDRVPPENLEALIKEATAGYTYRSTEGRYFYSNPRGCCQYVYDVLSEYMPQTSTSAEFRLFDHSDPRQFYVSRGEGIDLTRAPLPNFEYTPGKVGVNPEMDGVKTWNCEGLVHYGSNHIGALLNTSNIDIKVPADHEPCILRTEILALALILNILLMRPVLDEGEKNATVEKWGKRWTPCTEDRQGFYVKPVPKTGVVKATVISYVYASMRVVELSVDPFSPKPELCFTLQATFPIERRGSLDVVDRSLLLSTQQIAWITSYEKISREPSPRSLEDSARDSTEPQEAPPGKAKEDDTRAIQTPSSSSDASSVPTAASAESKSAAGEVLTASSPASSISHSLLQGDGADPKQVD